MAQLHIYNGSYGSVEPAAVSDSLNPQVHFHTDPALKRCSPSLAALTGGRNPVVPQSEVVTIEGDQEVLNAVKAMLARSLQAEWNRGYDQVMGTLDSRIAMGGSAAQAILGIAGGGANLEQALVQERAIANQAIERLIAELPNVQPHWMDVAVKGVYVSRDIDGTLQHGPAHAVEAAPVTSAPVPMAGWADADHIRYSDTRMQATSLQSGHYDTVAAVPVYLPVPAGGFLAQAKATATRVFNFGQSARPVPQPVLSGQQAAPSIDQAQAVMDLVMNTPILRKHIIEQPSQIVLDYQSCVESTVDSLRYGYTSDEDDWNEESGDEDDYGDGPGYNRPTGG